MTPQIESRAPRLQFSLAALLFGVTLFAVILGVVMYHARWIRARQEFAEAEDARFIARIGTSGSEQTDRAPGLLRLFGETGRADLLILVERSSRDEISAAEWARAREAKRLFPEAEIHFSHLGETSWSIPAE